MSPNPNPNPGPSLRETAEAAWEKGSRKAAVAQRRADIEKLQGVLQRIYSSSIRVDDLPFAYEGELYRPGNSFQSAQVRVACPICEVPVWAEFDTLESLGRAFKGLAPTLHADIETSCHPYWALHVCVAAPSDPPVMVGPAAARLLEALSDFVAEALEGDGHGF